MTLKINVGKSGVLVITKDQRGSCEKVRMSRKEMEEMNKVQVSGSDEKFEGRYGGGSGS